LCAVIVDRPDRRQCRGVLLKLRYRDQEFTPMSNSGYTELLEILCRKMTQYFRADGILTKCRLVAFQTERLQPPSNIHRRGSPDQPMPEELSQSK
jgi:hypothetical protein